MITDSMTRFLCERVLGWEWRRVWGDEYTETWNWSGAPTRDTEVSIPTKQSPPTPHLPDLASWEGFGLLLTALAKDGKEPVVGHLLRPIEGWHVVVRPSGEGLHSDPRTALVLAAARAYGFEEEEA